MPRTVEGFTRPDARSRLDHLGTYTRTMPVTLERMFENALDWEHLPYVHASSFSGIECLDAGPWGWRARLGMGAHTSEIELRLYTDQRRWITRTLTGERAGAEIWTHALVLDPEHLRVVVDFFLPNVAPEYRERVGRGYAAQYHQLYDEDEAMMVERQRALTLASSGRGDVDLGPAAALPGVVEHNDRRWRVVELDGGLTAFDSRCPHLLGPLDDAPVEDGIIRCPWHAYVFDLRTGRCISGASCRMHPRPVTIRDGRAWIENSN